MIFKSGISRLPHSAEGDAKNIRLHGVREAGLGKE
jgi:hypothetical protein